MSPQKVLYIMATGRSGTTILDNVVGSVDGFFSTGELHLIWTASLRRSGCGCGMPIRDCDIWSAVIRSCLGTDIQDEELSRLDELRRGEARILHTPRLLALAPRRLLRRPHLREYVALLGRLYKSIGNVTGARVVVDSSKTPANAALLPLIPEIDPYLIHIVRDPRAVAHSWQRHKPTLDRYRPEEMHRLGPVRSTARWTATNMLGEFVRRHYPPNRVLRTRYEDFVNDPHSAIRRVVALLEEPSKHMPFADERTVILGENHTVWGNRSRFVTGNVELNPDEEWAADSAAFTRLAVTGMAMPLLPRYGYPLRTRRSIQAETRHAG